MEIQPKTPRPRRRAPAADLASDILLMITRLADDRDAHYSLIINLTHVCRHWRRSLLSSPGLWTKIDIGLADENIAFLDALLVRSADYPLKVFIFPGNGIPSAGCGLVFSHVHRIATFEVYFRDPIMTDVTDRHRSFDYIHFLFNKPLPMLTYFRIVGYEIPIPEKFLEGIAPNLKNLEFAGSSISYRMPIFRTVTHLRLNKVRGITSVHQLMSLFESVSSNLKGLDIGDPVGLSPVSIVHIPEKRHVHFPSLKWLSLSLEIDVLMEILGHITTPSDVDWDIRCDSRRAESDVDISPWRSFFQNVQTGTHLNLHWRGELINMMFQQGFHGPRRGYLALLLELPGPDNIRQLEFLLTSLRLSQVRHCNLISHGPKGASIELYNEIFGSFLLPFSHLEKLEITDPFIKDQLLGQLLVQPDSTVPCPRLDKLTIRLGGGTDDTRLIQVLGDRKKLAGWSLKNLRVYVDPDEIDLDEAEDLRERLEDLAENIVITRRSLFWCPENMIREEEIVKKKKLKRRVVNVVY